MLYLLFGSIYRKTAALMLAIIFEIESAILSITYHNPRIAEELPDKVITTD